jgi:hypothetical protein
MHSSRYKSGFSAPNLWLKERIYNKGSWLAAESGVKFNTHKRTGDRQHHS